MTIYKCDHCGKKLDNVNRGIMMINYLSISDSRKDKLCEFDLCLECCQKVMDGIKTIMTKGESK